MDPRLPFLEISRPDDVHLRYPLTAERVTIGRFPEYNDVAHRPDRLVSGRGRAKGW